jgi:hypothetical protein
MISFMRCRRGILFALMDEALPKGLSLSQARDILWGFTGRDIYRMFVIERGWTSEEYEKWLACQKSLISYFFKFSFHLIITYFIFQ